jgi:hypothetical protein
MYYIGLEERFGRASKAIRFNNDELENWVQLLTKIMKEFREGYRSPVAREIANLLE